MPVNILMPALSPTMETGNLAKWLKKEGEAVKSGDVIAEIETDKATMEVEAVDEGILAKILVAEGAHDVAVNQPIAILLTEGEDESALSASPEAPPAKSDPEPAPEPPKKSSESEPVREEKSVTPVATESTAPGSSRVFASPLARRLAKDGGIDISRVSGSGPHGRIVRADVEAAKSGKAPLAAASSGSSALSVAPSMSDAQIMKLYEEGSYEVVPHDNVRKIIATRLVEAKRTIPHFYLTVDTEIDSLLALRKEINAAAPRDSDGNATWKISVNDMIIKAMALALQRVPDANVTWTESGMLKHTRSDVGVAVSIPGGLITPVVRGAETKRISEIAIEMKDLAARARQRKLAPHEYQGGTTAISNLGMMGIKDFAAVINPPHATILAVGAGIETPVVRKGEIKIATIMTVTLSTDHRAVDGALGAEFISAFKSLIEKPAGMLA